VPVLTPQTPVYATLAGLLNVTDPAFGARVVNEAAGRLHTFLANGTFALCRMGPLLTRRCGVDWSSICGACITYDCVIDLMVCPRLVLTVHLQSNIFSKS
jgi:hypothetical protein